MKIKIKKIAELEATLKEEIMNRYYVSEARKILSDPKYAKLFVTFMNNMLYKHEEEEVDCEYSAEESFDY